MKTEFTELELKLLKIMGTHDYVMVGDHEAHWGYFDKSFQNKAEKVGVTPRQISGIVSSLVKKKAVQVEECGNEGIKKKTIINDAFYVSRKVLLKLGYVK